MCLLRVAPLFIAAFLLFTVSSLPPRALAQAPAAQPPAITQIPDAPRVTAGAPGFGYWAPELRELHLRIPLQARAIGGDELFRPSGVTVNGQRVSYAYWYFDGVTHDYADMRHASRSKIEVYAAYPWRGGQEYAVKLS